MAFGVRLIGAAFASGGSRGSRRGRHMYLLEPTNINCSRRTRDGSDKIFAAYLLRSTGHSSNADRTTISSTRNRILFGAAPSVADPWRSRTTYRCSNPTPFSTTVGHYCSMKRLAHNSKTLHGSPRSAPVRPAPDPIPTSRPLSHRFRPSIPAPTPSRAPSSASVPTPANFNTSPSLHSICITPASAAPAASF